VDECKPLATGASVTVGYEIAVSDVPAAVIVQALLKTVPPIDLIVRLKAMGLSEAGVYTRPLFSSKKAHFVGYVGCMVFPQSITQRDTGRCDQNKRLRLS